MDKLNQCSITLTRACNLRCNFCYEKDTGYPDDDFISYEDLKKIIDFCDESMVKYVFFVGGEPLLYPKLIDILTYIRNKRHKMVPTIATNGIMLDNMEFCKKLITNGISYIDISLKGKDEDEFQNVTGQRCLSRQLAAIKNLSKLTIEFTCSMVLTNDNVTGFCDAIKKAYENGARQFSFTFVIDNQNSLDKDLTYLEKTRPLNLIESFINQVDSLNKICKDWWIEYSFPLCMYTKKQLDILNGKLAAPCQIFYRDSVFFDTKMNVIPCDMYTNIKMCKLGNDFNSHESFIDTRKIFLYKNTMDSLSKLPKDDCKTCNYLKSCYGGCPVLWKNYSITALEEYKKRWLSKDKSIV